MEFIYLLLLFFFFKNVDWIVELWECPFFSSVYFIFIIIIFKNLTGRYIKRSNSLSSVVWYFADWFSCFSFATCKTLFLPTCCHAEGLWLFMTFHFRVTMLSWYQIIRLKQIQLLFHCCLKRQVHILLKTWYAYFFSVYPCNVQLKFWGNLVSAGINWVSFLSCRYM